MAQTAGTGFSGKGVTVAVVDSGLPQNWPEFLPLTSVDLTHAAGFGPEGWGDFHNPVKAVRGVGGHIGLFPHGLAVASIIVGFPSEFGPVGGAAPGATILPIRVINQFNYSWFSWWTAGILYVGRLKRDGVLPGPVVINFSSQAVGDSQIVKDAIDFTIGQGVIFVTIAGNFGPAPGSIAFPGRLPESITAGAVGWTGEFDTPEWFFDAVPPNDPTQVYVAPFSGREPGTVPPGSLIDVLAPGSFVFGEWLIGPGFSDGREVAFDSISNFIFGTSFACPHVTGIVVQMLEKNPGLTQAQVEAILKDTALAIPPVPFAWGPDATGHGLARGSAAVAATPGP
jgi:subtilisin family serine protease